MRKPLTDIVNDTPRRMVIPLMGFRGTQLNGSTLRLNTSS